MTGPVLVVDFGTTTSSAVLVTAEGTQVVREPGSDRDWWPSAVCVDGDDVLVGSPAEQLKRFDPAAYRAEFKPDLGEREPIPLGEKSFLPQDLVAEVLAAVAAEAQQLNGGPIAHAVLMVPASYGAGDPRRDLMIEAGERVGFTEVELLPEPVAAAFAPVRGEPFAPGEVVLVYDFGGGTFDAALVEIAGDGRHRVLGHDAEAACGGRDMDAALRRRLRELGGEQLTALLTGDRATAGHLASELGELVRRVKHHLSDAATARDFLHAAGLRVTMERTELVELCRPVAEQSIVCCRRLLARHDVAPVAALLVGGTCRMPLVAETVEAALGIPVRFAREVSTAVVHGAAAWAEQSGDRSGPPVAADPDERPLRWDLPGGSGTLVRWLVEPRADYAAGAPLATVRLADGTLYRLTADDRPGTLARVHALPGTAVTPDDWLTTTRPPGKVPGQGAASPDERPGTAAATTDVSGSKGPATDRKDSTGAPHAAAGDRRYFPHIGALTVAFLDKGRLLAVAGEGAVVMRTVEGAWTNQLGTGSSGVSPLAATSDGRMLATTSGTTLVLWDSRTATESRRPQLAESATSLAVDARGEAVAVARRDGHVMVRLVAGHESLPAPRVRHKPLAGKLLKQIWVALSPDGGRLATGGGGAVHVWAARTGDHLMTLSNTIVGSPAGVLAGGRPEMPTMAVQFSPDGRRLATTSSRGAVVWDATTGQELVRMAQAPDLCADLCFSGDGAILATVGSTGTDLWDSATGERLRRFEGMSGTSVVFSPDGRWLATADPVANTVTLTPLASA
ncbi:Hsp70 family protein [Nocardioides sp.]|uniref:Hsp70 family protein n=1 Tax=Nocardioides sp. TaxID=35761 RepID=UPI003D0A2D06